MILRFSCPQLARQLSRTRTIVVIMNRDRPVSIAHLRGGIPLRIEPEACDQGHRIVMPAGRLCQCVSWRRMLSKVGSAGMNRSAHCIITLLLAGSLAFGQSPSQTESTATLQGTIRDSHGHAEPGAKVTLSTDNAAGVETTESNYGGRYQFSRVAPGRYRVRVQMPGFKEATSPEIIIGWRETKHLDLSLEPADVSTATDNQPQFFDPPS